MVAVQHPVSGRLADGSMLKGGVRSEDRATIGLPAYVLRQVEKIPRLTFTGKSKLLCFPHSSAARVLVLEREMNRR